MSPADSVDCFEGREQVFPLEDRDKEEFLPPCLHKMLQVHSMTFPAAIVN